MLLVSIAAVYRGGTLTPWTRCYEDDGGVGVDVPRASLAQQGHWGGRSGMLPPSTPGEGDLTGIL